MSPRKPTEAAFDRFWDTHTEKATLAEDSTVSDSSSGLTGHGFGLAKDILHKGGVQGLMNVALVCLLAYVVIFDLPQFKLGQSETRNAVTTMASEVGQLRVAIQSNNMMLADVEIALDKLRELDAQMDKQGGSLYALNQKLDRVLVAQEFSERSRQPHPQHQWDYGYSGRERDRARENVAP